MSTRVFHSFLGPDIEQFLAHRKVIVAGTPLRCAWVFRRR